MSKETLPTSVKKGSHKRQKPSTGEQKRSCVKELERGMREIEALGLGVFLSTAVLNKPRDFEPGRTMNTQHVYSAAFRCPFLFFRMYLL